MADDPRYGDRAGVIVKRIEGGEQVVTSTLVISQICGYLKWKKRVDAIPKFLLFLRSLPNLSKADTSFLDFVRAQKLLSETKTDWKLWDDLVIAAQMKRLDVGEIYSNDSDFDAIPGIRRIFE
jgi:predicted nucleic acid-binding protein